MPVIATESARIGNLIKNYDDLLSPELFVDILTVNEASAVSYPLGTVLGKVTATGKYMISKPAASDGSQTPVAVYIGTGDALGVPNTLAVAANTDTKVLALTRGKVVLSASALNLDSSINDATKRATAYAALKAVGLLVESTN